MPEEDIQDPQDAQEPQDVETPEPASPEADEPTGAPEAPPTAQADDETVDQDSDQDSEQEPEQDDLPPFAFEAADTDTLKKTITITVPEARIDAKRDELYGELGDSAQVPGFRIGRAPRRLIEKRFGKEVAQDVRNGLIGDALGYVGEEAEFRTIGEPDLKLDDIELPDRGDMVFSFDVEVAPEFDLPELKGIAVEKVVVEVNDQRVEEYIDRMRQQQPKFEESSEGAAAERDVVIADTKVTVEGIEAVAESSETPLRVAVGQVEGLPLLELGKELTGKTVGDTVTLTVDVPEAHPNEEWRGKAATIEITVTRLRRRILPEIGDEYAETMGFESMDEMRQYVSKQMESQVVGETRRAMRDQIGQYLIDNTDFELPPTMASRHAAQTLQRRYVDLMHQGVPREQIEEHITELKAAAETEAARDLKLQFIVAQIAQADDIEADEGEINSRIAEIAARNNRRPERVRHELEQDGSIGQIESQIVEEKVFDALLEDAEITEISREEAQARQAAAQAAAAEQAPEQPTAQAAAAEQAPEQPAAEAETGDDDQTSDD